MKNRTVMLFALFLLIISCTSNEETYTVETIDGVKHIHNLAPAWGSDQKIELEFVRKIGGIEVDDEDYLLMKPRDCVRDSEGNHYIIHDDDKHVVKYDKDWKRLGSFCDTGQGPGEIEGSYGAEIDTNVLFVVNAGLGGFRIEKIDFDGNAIDRIQIPRQAFDVSIQKSGNLVLPGKSFQSLTGEEFSEPFVAVILDNSGGITKYFCIGEKFPSRREMSFMNNIKLGLDSKDNIYITFQSHNRIDKYSPDGDFIFTMTRSLNYEVVHGVEKFTDSAGREREYPIPANVSNYIRIDSKDRLWASTYNRQPEDKGSTGSTLKEEGIIDFDIFDSEGIFLTRITSPVRFYKHRIYDDLLYLIDPYHETCIYIYRIIEK
ncbi:hypothetical protein ACFL6O_02215 [candidate division KSB1 bacterium]